MTAAVLAAALAAAPAAAAERPVHILAFRSAEHALSLPLVDAWEAFLRQERLSVRSADNVPSRSDGDQYAFEAGVTAQGPSEALETVGDFVLALPPAPDLLRRFEAYARSPEETGGRPSRLARRRVSLESGGAGAVLMTVTDSEMPRQAFWADGVALVYTLAGGQKVVFVHRTRGGLGRVAALAQGLRSDYGDELLVLSRGEGFEYAASSGAGSFAALARLGVNAAVPGVAEFAHLSAVVAPRPADGGPVVLCANLNPAAGAVGLPGRAVFPVAGLRVGVFGLARPAYARLLSPEDARRYSLGDPLTAARVAAAALRREADVVVALTSLAPAENAELRRQVPGIDLIIGDTLPVDPDAELASVTAEAAERGPEDAALLVTADAPAVALHVTVRRGALGGGRYGLSVRSEGVRLDEALADLPGFAPFPLEAYGVRTDTAPPLLPAARDLYAAGGGAASVRLKDLDFWRLSATLLADRLGVEAAFLPVLTVKARTMGGVPEGVVRSWFLNPDRLVTVELPGPAFKDLLAKARRLEDPTAEAPPGGLRLAVGGVAPGELVHGLPVDPRTPYRVALTERILAQGDQFPEVRLATATRADGGLEDDTVAALRGTAGWPLERLRALLSGAPVRRAGLWRVNFRDEGFNVSDTKVVSDPRLASVPNARVQGFDQLLLGAASKTDLEYLSQTLKWTNTLELEYQRSRLRPPTGDVLSTPQDRADARTAASLNVARFPWAWVARAAGPSLGLEYEGQLERLPYTRRKHKVSVLPGVELFNGTLLHSVTLAANLQRDFTPPLPVDQYGARLRALLSTPLGAGGKLSGELNTDYFFLTHTDSDQDLRFELDAIAKLEFPVMRRFTMAPFIDFYFFKHKVTPANGYSAITGVSLGFSRLWKPGFERF